MPVLDTSVLLEALDGSTARCEQARRALAKARPLWVPAATLVEGLQILRQRARAVGVDGNVVSREALAYIRSHHGYRMPPAPSEPSVSALFLGDSTLSYADCLIVQTAVEAGDELLTYDMNQKRAFRRAKAS